MTSPKDTEEKEITKTCFHDLKTLNGCFINC